jgi:hypothetical protein
VDEEGEPRDLSQLFDEEEEEGEDGQPRRSQRDYEEDDLDDFIIDDEMGEDPAQRRERIRQRKERMEAAGNRGADYGVSDE